MGRFTGPARWPETGGKRAVQAHGAPRPTVTPDAPPATGPDATDAAKALAAEHGIRLENVTGTGSEGRITKDDVQTVVDAATAPPAEPLIPDEAEAPPAAETA